MATLADVFRTLDEMKGEGVITEYAIGGAMAALFYTEVTRTYDVDVFAWIPSAPGRILDMTRLYAWAREHDFEPHAEHLLIHTVPVQFLPANEGLEHEAVMQAQVLEYEGVAVRVMRPEYLIPLYVRAGSAARRQRALLLVQTGAVNTEELNALLARYNLSHEWQKIQAENSSSRGSR